MSQTPNYQLPLFTANDIPNWLTDWNQSMTDIDSALAKIQADAIGQGANVDELQNNVNTINNSLVNITNNVTNLNDYQNKRFHNKALARDAIKLDYNGNPNSFVMPQAGWCLVIYEYDAHPVTVEDQFDIVINEIRLMRWAIPVGISAGSDKFCSMGFWVDAGDNVRANVRAKNNVECYIYPYA